MHDIAAEAGPSKATKESEETEDGARVEEQEKEVGEPLDKQIKRSLVVAFAQSGIPAFAALTVDVKTKVVYLDGTLESHYERSLARQIAERTSGVTKVIERFVRLKPYLIVGTGTGVTTNALAIPPTITGLLPKNSTASFRDVTDGLSNTIAVLESAGRPYVYRRGPVVAGLDLGVHRVNAGGWSRAATDIAWAPTDRTGALLPATVASSVAFNYGNGDDVGPNTYGATGDPLYGTEGTSQPFGFHGSGINILFGDGSVRFVDDQVNVPVFYNLLTRAGSETVSNTNY